MADHFIRHKIFIKMKVYFIILFFVVFANAGVKAQATMRQVVDSIYISKSKKEMSLFQNGELITTYTISIGENEIGHKQQQGDNRTPEGLYIINDRNPNSRYYRNLGISYPNDNDIAIARIRNVDAGGEIKIHGYADKRGSTKEQYVRFSNTWGCIGVCNAEMKEIYNLVKVGARILIAP